MTRRPADAALEAAQTAKRQRFAIVPAALAIDPELARSALAVRTYVLLATYADKTGKCWPRQETLASILKTSTAMVSQAIALLERRRFLVKMSGSRRTGFVYKMAEGPADGGDYLSPERKIKDAEMAPYLSPQRKINDPAEASFLSLQREINFRSNESLSFATAKVTQLYNSPNEHTNEQTNLRFPQKDPDPTPKPAGGGDEGKPHRKPRSEPDEVEPDFAIWWDQYPRKTDKAAAFAAYRKARKIAAPEELLSGAMRYAAERTGEDPRFTKYPATWLNKQCWTNESVTVGGGDDHQNTRTENRRGRSGHETLIESGAAAVDIYRRGDR